MQKNEFTKIKSMLRELEDKIDASFVLSDPVEDHHLVQLAHNAVGDRLVTSEGVSLDPNSEDIINLLNSRSEPQKVPMFSKLKENAQFILRSSEKVGQCSEEILNSMREAFENGFYQQVTEIAFQQDIQKRKQQCKQKTEERYENGCDEPLSKEEHDQSLLASGCLKVTEELKELQGVKVAPVDSEVLGLWTSVLKDLAGDLTYDNRAKAKEKIRRITELYEPKNST